MRSAGGENSKLPGQLPSLTWQAEPTDTGDQGVGLLFSYLHHGFTTAKMLHCHRTRAPGYYAAVQAYNLASKV